MIIPDDDNKIKNLCAFVETWAGPSKPEYGISPDKIDPRIPAPLRELYAFAGNWPNPRVNNPYDIGLFQEQDCLISYEKLKINGYRLHFVYENQSNWSCEVELDQDDPPVYCDIAEAFGEGEGFEIVCDSLSHFLVTFCLQELTLSSKYMGNFDCTSIDELSHIAIKPIWLNGHYVYNEPSHDYWLVNGKILIMCLHGEDFWFACQNAEDYKCLNNPRPNR